MSLIYILISIITTEPDTINLVADVPTSSTENQHNKKNKTKNYHNYNNAYEVRKVGDTLDLFGKNKKMSENGGKKIALERNGWDSFLGLEELNLPQEEVEKISTAKELFNLLGNMIKPLLVHPHISDSFFFLF